MKNKREVYTQVSLDLTNIEEALRLAEAAVRAGIDWLEAGTPLILAEGLRAVQELKRRFPDHPVVADLKTMDGAGLEAEMMINAGADYVVVMSQAHWASVEEMVRVTHELGAEVMADILNAPQKPEAARKMQDLGVDWIIHHVGYDERNYVQNISPLDEIDDVLEATTLPLQAVGGLSIEQALETIRRGASSIVIGAPLAIQADRFATGDEFEQILAEVVRKTREASR
jgi:3-hexulose-6-phosphate synthase/6-phospho-3-hexuloisomerase